MRNFKYLVIATIVGCFLAAPAYAENKGQRNGKGKNLDHKVMKMQKKLELSNEQADKIYAILNEARESRGEGDSSCKDLESFSERAQCRESKKSAVKNSVGAVLNDEQKVKWTEMQEQRKERKGKRGKRQGAFRR